MWQIQCIPTPVIWVPQPDVIVIGGEGGGIIGGESDERIGAETEE